MLRGGQPWKQGRVQRLSESAGGPRKRAGQARRPVTSARAGESQGFGLRRAAPPERRQRCALRQRPKNGCDGERTPPALSVRIVIVVAWSHNPIQRLRMHGSHCRALQRAVGSGRRRSSAVAAHRGGHGGRPCRQCLQQCISSSATSQITRCSAAGCESSDRGGASWRGTLDSWRNPRIGALHPAPANTTQSSTLFAHSSPPANAHETLGASGLGAAPAGELARRGPFSIRLPHAHQVRDLPESGCRELGVGRGALASTLRRCGALARAALVPQSL